jgi:hypothetical protein
VTPSDLGDRRPILETLFNDLALLIPLPGSALAPHRRQITIFANRHLPWCPSSDSGHDHRATLQTAIANVEINARRPTAKGYTESGTKIEGPVTEAIQGLNLMNLYLAQFRRGYTHTSVYLLRDRTDEDGNQSFGFYKADYSPRKAAIYLHNLTTILADNGTIAKPGQLEFTIVDQPKTVHELLLQHSDGTFQLILWDERLSGQDSVRVDLGVPHTSGRIYDPTIGVEPIRTTTDISSVELALSDHPIVIAISPNGQ